MVESVYKGKALKKTAIYSIIKKVKNGKNTNEQHHLNSTNWSRARPSSCLLTLQLKTKHCGSSYCPWDVSFHHLLYNLLYQDFGLEKIGKMGHETSLGQAETAVWRGLHQAVNSIPQLISHHTLQMKNSVPAVDQEGPAWPNQSQGQCQPDQTDAALLAFFDRRASAILISFPRAPLSTWPSLSRSWAAALNSYPGGAGMVLSQR